MCVAVVDIDISYLLSTGEVACMVEEQVTYSTEFGDSFVVMENCCSGAVEQLEASNFNLGDLNTFCH